MKTVTLEGIVVGNGKYNATIQVSPEVEEALLRQGALRILQGAPSGAAEKELAYPGDKVKRPEGFNRKAIPFDEKFEAVFAKHYKAAEVEIGRDDDEKAIKAPLGVTEISFEEYTGPEKAEPKYKAQKDLINLYLFEADGKTPRKAADGTERTAALFAEKRGIPAPTEPWDEDTEFLKAVKAWEMAQRTSED